MIDWGFRKVSHLSPFNNINLNILLPVFSEKIHLSDALWIGCGSLGVRVWLPLFPPSHHPTPRNSASSDSAGLELQLLTSRRITLTFSLDTCYPLSVLFKKAVVLGVNSETVCYCNDNCAVGYCLHYYTTPLLIKAQFSWWDSDFNKYRVSNYKTFIYNQYSAFLAQCKSY